MALLRRLHRWFGLFIAVFLFVAGATGAVISWDHELDAWLNPQLYHAHGAGQPQDSLVLADALEARDPRLQVTWLPLAVEPGHALLVGVDPRPDPATGRLPELADNQVALDPVTGAEQGRREWGRISLARTDLLPFLYKLHYSLHLPAVGGVETGVLFMGLVAIVWTIDCFVALRLSFPNLKQWRRSLVFRVRERGLKLLFDVHRSGGVWVWAVLLVLAVSAVSMNLGQQVVRPLVSLVSPLSVDPFAAREPAPEHAPVVPRLTRAEVVALARQEGLRRGWDEPPGGVFYAELYGLYGVGFFAPGNEHGDGGLGNAWLYYDALTGSPAGDHVPGTGSVGDVFLQAQFPLHSGRILGTPGRALMTLMGLAVAALSATGVYLWARRQVPVLRGQGAGAAVDVPSLGRL
jgi:uncharacterized iron-regulated membrane protein